MAKKSKYVYVNGTIGDQSTEALIARHKTKLSSEFTSAWTQEDCNEFIEVGCSLTQDNEWANESI